jgi:hypothetical protein
LLFLPPDFFRVVNKDFSGVDEVISSNMGANLCLVPAVTGFNFFNPMAQYYTLL